MRRRCVAQGLGVNCDTLSLMLPSNMSCPWLLVALACILSAGCQGRANSNGVLPLADLAEMAEQAVCSQEVRCGLFADVASCKAASVWKMDPLVASINAGRIQYDGKAAAACIEALAALGCNLTDPSDDAAPPVCVSAFRGSVAVGGSCFMDDDCVSGNCGGKACSLPVDCCAGACVAEARVPTIPAGGSCYPPGGSGNCADGTYCDNASAGSTCVTGIVLGQPCDPVGVQSAGCQPPGTCRPSNNSTLGGTCMPPPAEGETCDTNAAICNSSLDYCDNTGTCVRKLAVGIPCPDRVGCVDYAVCSSGTCISKKKPGEVCDGEQVDPCMGVLVCSGGICSLPSDPVCLNLGTQYSVDQDCCLARVL